MTGTRRNLDTLYETEEVAEIQNAEDGKMSRATILAFLQYEFIGRSAFEKHKEKIDVQKAKQEIEQAKDEWDTVSSTINVAIKETPRITEPICCEEVLSYFRAKDMSSVMKYIKPVKQRKRFEEMFRWLIGPPKLHPNLIPDRNLIFAIAQCPFDTTDAIHVRVLQTLYKVLTGSPTDCPRYGQHWEEIGFQGIDPGTDLRGVGFLGLVHLIHFVLSPQTSELAKEISNLAQSEMQNFPFCVMGINISRIVLETLREEALNRICNRQRDVLRVTNDLYVGIYLRLYHIWKEQKKTIVDSGYVLKDLSLCAKKNPDLIFQELSNYYESKANSFVHSIPQTSFTDIGVAVLSHVAAVISYKTYLVTYKSHFLDMKGYAAGFACKIPLP